MLKTYSIENSAAKVFKKNHSKAPNIAKMCRINSERYFRIEQGKLEAHPARTLMQADHDHQQVSIKISRGVHTG